MTPTAGGNRWGQLVACLVGMMAIANGSARAGIDVLVVGRGLVPRRSPEESGGGQPPPYEARCTRFRSAAT
jgi:hypothetical protein